MAAETGQRILENNYEKKRSSIGNKFMQNVSTGKVVLFHPSQKVRNGLPIA